MCHILLIKSVISKVNAPFQLSTLQSIVTAIIAGLLMIPFESAAPTDFIPMLPQLTFAGIVAVGLGFTLQLVAQRHTTAASAALILSLESVFAAFFGWLLLDEKLSFIGFIGCSLIFISIILAEMVGETHVRKVGRFFYKTKG